MNKLISWVEIPVTDFERAVDFYKNLLDIEFNIVEGNGEKMACFPGGEGSLSYSKGFNPGTDGALVSFSVNDIASSFEMIKSNGGEILQDLTKIEAENRGHFAIIKDCEGNKIGLYQD